MMRRVSPRFAVRTLAFAAAASLAAPLWAAPARPLATVSRPPSVAPAAPQPAAAANGPAARQLDLYMSDTRDGDPKRGFSASIVHSVYAVVAYEDASNERYDVRVFDLAGLQVKRQSVGPLSGSGRQSVEVTTEDFVNGYKVAVGRQEEAIREALASVQDGCAAPPPAPTVWPPQPPVQPTARPGQPTPTPLPPDPYLPFRDSMSEAINRLRTGTTELTRTVQAMTRLPDLGRTPAGTGLEESRQTLAGTDLALDTIVEMIRPQQGLPKPREACDSLAKLRTRYDSALAKVDDALTNFPTVTAEWRLPATSARYVNGQFSGCEAYLTQIYRYVGGSPSDTAAKTTNWAIGFPGAAALVFPGPDLVDPNSAGQIGFSLPTGAPALYAKSVGLPNVNHSAKLSAFVTDAQCLPLEGETVTFSVNPAAAAGVTPNRVMTKDGLAEVTLESGMNAAHGAEAFAIVCADPCTNPKPLTGRTRFEVVGLAKRLDIVVSPKELNIRDAGNPTRRPGILVHATDAVTQGHSVADGTSVKVTVAGPAVLAYDRRPILNGVPQAPESFVVGKEMTLVTEYGNAVVPPSADLGYQNEKRLYILPEGQQVGCLTLYAEADGVKADSDDHFADGNTRKSICIVRKAIIHLPYCLKRFDVRATPPGRLPTLTPEPPATRTPRP